MIKTYTLSAALISLALLGLFYWWFQSDWLILILYAGVGLIATLSVPLLYRLLGYSAADDDAWLRERENREYTELSQRLQSIQTELEGLQLTEGVRQAKALNDIIDDYHAVVNSRFFGKKSSPLTYLGAARTVQKTAIQNLADMVTIGHSISTIENNRQAGSQMEDTRYLEQAERLRHLLDDNTKLFDALTATAVEVANMQSISEFERTDTLARLLALAEVAHQSGASR